MPYQYIETEPIQCPKCGIVDQVSKLAKASYCYCGERLKPPITDQERAREDL